MPIGYDLKYQECSSCSMDYGCGFCQDCTPVPGAKPSNYTKQTFSQLMEDGIGTPSTARRICKNCRYYHNRLNEPPCYQCEDNSEWRGNTPDNKEPTKMCTTCKHLSKFNDQRPCSTCANEDKWEPKSDKPKTDSKWHDQHYQGDIQPIEVMQANMEKESFIGFCLGNIIKYVLRCGKKDDPIKELDKIIRYAMWAKKAIQNEKINPRED